MVYFHTKKLDLGTFLGPWNAEMLVYFISIFCGHIRYIFPRLGTFYQENSCNRGVNNALHMACLHEPQIVGQNKFCLNFCRPNRFCVV
jgi:hypothetical protein